jgi:hypothetical protein
MSDSVLRLSQRSSLRNEEDFFIRAKAEKESLKRVSCGSFDEPTCIRSAEDFKDMRSLDMPRKG